MTLTNKEHAPQKLKILTKNYNGIITELARESNWTNKEESLTLQST